MAKNSNVDMKDGATLHVRSFSPENPTHAVLMLPGLGASAYHDFYSRIAKELMNEEIKTYIAELRGHAQSEGVWSLDAHRQDIVHLIETLKINHEQIYVIAGGLSASLLMEHEDNAHFVTKAARPALPDGMVLLSPTFHGATLLPRTSSMHRVGSKALPFLKKPLLRGLLKKINKKRGHTNVPKKWSKTHYGYCRVPPERVRKFWEEVAQFNLAPVRIQTPTIMFMPFYTSHDPLVRVFGNTNIRRVRWIPHGPYEVTRPEWTQSVHDVTSAILKVMDTERPIRFRSKS